MAKEENRSGKKEKNQKTTYTGFSFKLSFRMYVDGEGAERAFVGEVVGIKELSVNSSSLSNKCTIFSLLNLAMLALSINIVDSNPHYLSFKMILLKPSTVWKIRVKLSIALQFLKIMQLFPSTANSPKAQEKKSPKPVFFL